MFQKTWNLKPETLNKKRSALCVAHSTQSTSKKLSASRCKIKLKTPLNSEGSEPSRGQFLLKNIYLLHYFKDFFNFYHPCSKNLKLKTWNLKHETLNLKPETRNPSHHQNKSVTSASALADHKIKTRVYQLNQRHPCSKNPPPAT